MYIVLISEILSPPAHHGSSVALTPTTDKIRNACNTLMLASNIHVANSPSVSVSDTIDALMCNLHGALCVNVGYNQIENKT